MMDAREMALDAVTDLLMAHGCGDSDQCERTAKAAIAIWERTMAEAGWVRAERKLLAEAHACMRATGWQLAMASDVQGDGVLQAAVSDVEDRFAAMLAGRAGEEGTP